MAVWHGSPRVENAKVRFGPHAGEATQLRANMVTATTMPAIGEWPRSLVSSVAFRSCCRKRDRSITPNALGVPHCARAGTALAGPLPSGLSAPTLPERAAGAGLGCLPLNALAGSPPSILKEAGSMQLLTRLFHQWTQGVVQIYSHWLLILVLGIVFVVNHLVQEKDKIPE